MRKRCLFGDRRALSPLVSTLLLVVVAVIGGATVYVVFFSKASEITADARFEIQNLELRRTSAGTLLTVSVKNTGSVGFDDVVIEAGDMTFSASSWSVSTREEWLAGTHENTVAGSLRLLDRWDLTDPYPEDNPPFFDNHLFEDGAGE
jgi:flagellin-like protein